MKFIKKFEKAPLGSLTNILVLYTGGTFGMHFSVSKKTLVPLDFGNVIETIPELERFNFGITILALKQPIDSSNVEIAHWKIIAQTIECNYANYSGFVVLHGTDTMAFSASALSYMLQGLNKPVVFTGAQLPIGEIRNDARENFITALQITASTEVKEVCIYFDNVLVRGNRSRKIESEQFHAFVSDNYPSLATVGVNIEYNYLSLFESKNNKLQVFYSMDSHVAVLKVYPGITSFQVKSVLQTTGLKGLVLESYGAGNTTTQSWFVDVLRQAIEGGLLVLNVSQCNGGTVQQGMYETSQSLNEIGVISGKDMTFEAAITKLMHVIANYSYADCQTILRESICGEITI